MIFLVDFTLLITHLLGSFLRRIRMIAWLACLLAPVKILHADFRKFRDDKLRELSYNSQTMMFEKLLNDKFPNPANRIYIQNVNSVTVRNYIYNLSENERPLYISNLSENPKEPYIQSLIELNSDYDFIVFVPASLTFDLNQMNAIIRKYKLAGKRYVIKKY